MKPFDVKKLEHIERPAYAEKTEKVDIIIFIVSEYIRRDSILL